MVITWLRVINWPLGSIMTEGSNDSMSHLPVSREVTRQTLEVSMMGKKIDNRKLKRFLVYNKEKQFPSGIFD